MPHSDVNQAQRVMCEPAAHNPRHQGMPVFADAFDQCSRTPAAPIAIPARFSGRFREGDGQRDRRLSSFSFGVLNALNEKRSNCAGKCAIRLTLVREGQCWLLSGTISGTTSYLAVCPFMSNIDNIRHGL